MSGELNFLVRTVGARDWVEPELSGYVSEAELQHLLIEDPTRIPGVEDGARAVEELSTSGGPIDVLSIGPDGSITVVECKLGRNTEPRRMVIGQVLDYASALAADGYGALERSWHARGGPPFHEWLSPAEVAVLQGNLGEARMNLCLAVDRIDDDLRRLVEFLNRITSHDVAVAALQLQHARHGAVEIIVPTTFGAEMASSKARRGLERERWTKESFLAALTDDNDRLTVAELFKRVEATATEMMGHHTLFSFGLVPAGGVMLYPYGVQFSPAQLSVSGGGRATVFGNWSWYSKVAGNDGFAPLAQLLGQDHRGSAAQVPLREIDLETLWVVITGTAQALSMTRADGTGVRDPS